MKVKKSIKLSNYKFDDFHDFTKTYIEFVERVLGANNESRVYIELLDKSLTYNFDSLEEVKSHFENSSKFFWIKLRIEGDKVDVSFDVYTFENIRMNSKFELICESRELLEYVEDEYHKCFMSNRRTTLRTYSNLVSILVAGIVFIMLSFYMTNGQISKLPEVIYDRGSSIMIFNYFISILVFFISKLILQVYFPTFNIPLSKSVFSRVIEYYRKNSTERGISIMEAIVIGIVFFVLGKHI